MKNNVQLTVLYSAFAGIATLVNLGTQALVVLWSHTAVALVVSVLAGTASGLAVKYWLDKHYIFRFVTRDLSHDGRLFALYTTMGGVTTIIFWGMEFLFQHLYQTDVMRYTGGALGLVIGYLVKYQLDKRFVFVHPASVDSGKQAYKP